MDQDAITQYITSTFADIQIDTSTPDIFFMYDPELKFPFATIVTRDTEFDHDSNLERPAVFRLNIGISKSTFQHLFGGDAADTSHDLAAFDQIMPHPIYGRMYWVCAQPQRGDLPGGAATAG